MVRRERDRAEPREAVDDLLDLATTTVTTIAARTQQDGTTTDKGSDAIHGIATVPVIRPEIHGTDEVRITGRVDAP